MSKRTARPIIPASDSLVSTLTQPFAAVDARGTDASDSASVLVGGSLFSRARQPQNPISHAQIEIVLSRSVAGIAIIFIAQTLPIMLDQLSSRKIELALSVSGLLGVAIVAFVIGTLVRRGIRTTAIIVSAVYLVALILWPSLMLDPTAVLDGKPWLWYLCTVATSCAALALPLVWAAAYTVVAPLIYGFIRVMPSGGSADAALAVLDAAYATLLGGVVLIIIYVLREATATVDTAQSNALAKYAVAVRHHATEVERVEVDSIVHDSVLATLLSAAGVHNAKSAELAAIMARNAILRLQDASGERNLDDLRVHVSELGARIRLAATAAGKFTITELGLDNLSIPEHVADALYSASVQAITNSVQHAGPADARRIVVAGNDQGGCTVTISDTGRGFEISTVSSARLGLRVSIQERVAAAGGVADITSSRGRGTSIRLSWPRPDDAASSEDAEWAVNSASRLSARDAGDR